MKKFFIFLLAAVTGSLMTFGIFQAFDMLNPRVVTIENNQGVPVMNSKFSSNTAGLVSMNDFTAAAEKSMPSVVHIKSTHINEYTPNRSRDPFRDFFGDDFFHYQKPKSRESVATGSGVIFSQDGYIITNNHVIEGADKIEVSLHDNRLFPAEVIGSDPSTDLALIKINTPDLTAVQLANSDEVRVGEFVLAVGNPFNLTSTVTAGIVSAKARNINILQGETALEAFIQTDAAVNPGNSGGALVNTDGKLIGINSAIASPTGAYAGYSFAIPVNIVNKVFNDLKKFGVVQRGYIGVKILPVTSQLVEEFNLAVNNGVYVSALMENSSAEKAGIKAGDVIISINNKKVTTPIELQEIVGSHNPGDKVEVEVNRSGSTKEFEIVLHNIKGNTEVIEKNEIELASRLGISLEKLSKKELKDLNLKNGIRVKDIKEGKVFYEAGIREGFIILSVDRQVVDDIQELKDILASKKGGVLIEGVYPGYPRVYFYGIGL